MYTYTLYEFNGGYGFTIENDGSPCITQDYMPDVEGNVIMTEEEAIYWTGVIIARLEG